MFVTLSVLSVTHTMMEICGSNTLGAHVYTLKSVTHFTLQQSLPHSPINTRLNWIATSLVFSNLLPVYWLSKFMIYNFFFLTFSFMASQRQMSHFFNFNLPLPLVLISMLPS